jgi:hypothetical protein
MNRLSSLAARAAAFAAACAITTLLVFVHAADLAVLGSHQVAVAGVAGAPAAAAVAPAAAAVAPAPARAARPA